MKAQLSNLNKLIEVLDRLNDLVENYSIYIYLIDENYYLLWYNDFTRDKFQLSPENNKLLCYKALWKFDRPCDDCLSHLGNNARRAGRYKIKRRLPDSDDESYLELISLPVFTSEGVIEGFLKIAIDITPVEKRQIQLREKEKLFTTIIETSSDAIYILDKDDRIISWNKGAEEIFGYSQEEIIGKSNTVLIPEELIELGEKYYLDKELTDKGYIRRYETQRVDKTGRLIHVDLISNLIKDDSGKDIARSVMIKDITARKELENELRRSIQELTKLNELNEILHTTYVLNDILQIILIAVTAGEGLKFNRAFLLLKDPEGKSLKGHLAIGPDDESQASRLWISLQNKLYSLKDVVREYKIDQQGVDRNLNELIKQIIVPLSQKNNILIQCLSRSEAYHVINGKIPGRRIINFNVNGKNLIDILGTQTFLLIPLIYKKEPLGVLIVDNRITQRDITEEEIETLKLFANQASMAIENARLYDSLEERIKELQAAYKKLEMSADRLVKAERLAAIGEVATSVAHEIRNPLVSIGGFARLLKKRLPHNKEVEKYATIITSQVDHLEHILNNILNIASPKKPRLRDIDMHKIIHQALIVMEGLIHGRQIKLNLEWSCEDSLVIGDEKLLFQALLNVIKNALEAMDDEMALDIKTLCDEKFVQIQIKDQGGGISGQDLNKVYDPFFTTKSEGTGLGLSVVRQIIQDHQGKIEIISHLNKGTIVKIFIPRSIPKQKKNTVENL